MNKIYELPTHDELLLKMIQCGRHARTLAATNRTPTGEKILERIDNPVPGDLVIETHKFYPDKTCIGIFVERLWDQDHPDGEKQHPDYHLWSILSSCDGAVRNWGNSTWITLIDGGMV
jgi:hypothetical protein